MSVTPYIPSHQDLARHPKTRKAARKAGVTVPTMIGHLHLLWWWALDLAPDGDLSRFEDDDLADAALWDGDPETFVGALVDCGPGDSHGFLEPGRQLHDWDDYGGKYRRRVEAGKRAAAARWQSEGDADAEPPQTDDDATALRPHSDGNAAGNASGNAEERRGEEKPLGADKRRKPKARDPDPIFDAVLAACGLDQAELTSTARGAVNKAAQQFREIGATPDGIKARADVHRRKWPDAECTPSSLAKNYAQLGAKVKSDRPRQGTGGVRNG